MGSMMMGTWCVLRRRRRQSSDLMVPRQKCEEFFCEGKVLSIWTHYFVNGNHLCPIPSRNIAKETTLNLDL